MIEILCAVVEADGIKQMFVQNLLHFFRVSIFHGAIEIPEILLFYSPAKPPQYRVPVNGFHFRVGNPNPQENRGFFKVLALFRQIPGKIEEIPQILTSVPHILISDFFMNL